MSIALAERWAGFDADAIDAVARARAMLAPLFVIGDGADPRMPPEVVRRVFEAHAGPRELWIVPGVGHTGAASHPDYWTRVMGFLARHGVTCAEPRTREDGAGGST
jgi:pimeloyl-ACP methyl ester carboxylesterase